MENQFWFNFRRRSFAAMAWGLCAILCLLTAISLSAQPAEICDNGIDDDLNGFVDLNDTACVCQVIEPVSHIPNPSFEILTCCPQNRSQLDCAEGWVQASEPTTDFIHDCGWGGWEDFQPPRPFPDGQGIMGFRDGRVIGAGGPEPEWKEYAGACLISPLLAGVEYRFEFFIGFYDAEHSPAIDVTFFGTTDCNNLPFGAGNTNFGCPTNDPKWSRLAETNVFAFVGIDGPWKKATIDIIPTQDIYAVAIGPPCQRTSSALSTYYFFDNLILDELRSFDYQINEISHPCKPDFSLAVNIESDIDYQWYKDGVAILNEKSGRLTKMYGTGEYQLRLLNDTECFLTRAYYFEKPIKQSTVSRTICAGQSLALGSRQLTTSGFYKDTLISIDNCDSIVEVDLSVIGQAFDSVVVKIFEGEAYRFNETTELSTPGNHIVRIPDETGCDSLIFVTLSYYQVYIPNAFSPNSDGVNDYFNVFGGPDLIIVQHMQIFDRWGSVIYEEQASGENGVRGWNGEKELNLISPGIYLYQVGVLMDDEKTRSLHGSLMIVE